MKDFGNFDSEMREEGIKENFVFEEMDIKYIY